METQKAPQEKQPSPVTPNPAAAAAAMASCRKKKSDDATLLEDLKDHIDEFIHASMDEHKTCFKKTIQKVISTLMLPVHVNLPFDCLVFVYPPFLTRWFGLLFRCLACQKLLRKGMLRPREWKAFFPFKQLSRTSILSLLL